MKQPVTILFLTAASGLANAESCMDITDDQQRLACFEAASECTGIASDEDRLACLDRAFAVAPRIAPPAATQEPAAVAEPPAAPVTRPAGEPPAAVPAAETTARAPVQLEGEELDQFGKRWSEGDEPAQYIEATIVEVRTNPSGLDYVLLDNGQLWRKTTRNTLRFRVGRKVTISDGIMASYDLQMEGYNKIVKVKRIQR